MSPPFNLIISNVPGPSAPLYMAGAQLKHFYPVSALADGQGLNMTVQSYNGNLDFGFVACRELVPDVWLLTELLQASMGELLAAAESKTAVNMAGRPQRELTPRHDRLVRSGTTSRSAARVRPVVGAAVRSAPEARPGDRRRCSG